ncbi:hypothetical protein FOBRF1_011146 [Fusarium oxysporum]
MTRHEILGNQTKPKSLGRTLSSDSTPTAWVPGEASGTNSNEVDVDFNAENQFTYRHILCRLRCLGRVRIWKVVPA